MSDEGRLSGDPPPIVSFNWRIGFEGVGITSLLYIKMRYIKKSEIWRGRSRSRLLNLRRKRPRKDVYEELVKHS